VQAEVRAGVLRTALPNLELTVAREAGPGSTLLPFCAAHTFLFCVRFPTEQCWLTMGHQSRPLPRRTSDRAPLKSVETTNIGVGWPLGVLEIISNPL